MEQESATTRFAVATFPHFPHFNSWSKRHAKNPDTTKSSSTLFKIGWVAKMDPEETTSDRRARIRSSWRDGTVSTRVAILFEAATWGGVWDPNVIVCHPQVPAHCHLHGCRWVNGWEHRLMNSSVALDDPPSMTLYRRGTAQVFPKLYASVLRCRIPSHQSIALEDSRHASTIFLGTYCDSNMTAKMAHSFKAA
jgi:hypothetical protein